MVYWMKSSTHCLKITKFDAGVIIASKVFPNTGGGLTVEYQTAWKNIICMQVDADNITVFFEVFWRIDKWHLHATNTLCWYSDSMLHTREHNVNFCERAKLCSNKVYFYQN